MTIIIKDVEYLIQTFGDDIVLNGPSNIDLVLKGVWGRLLENCENDKDLAKNFIKNNIMYHLKEAIVVDENGIVKD